ncbi:MAG: tetratricopeptide repeat protein [Clostridium sp.]|uniref:tetratricopeptide repeat protein n=1 Tax=Clostridium sp. TaxID=1506 RepID=UPI003D6CE358
MVKLDKLKPILNSSKLKELGVKKIALYLVVLCVTVISITFITITHKRSELSKLVAEAETHFFAQEYDLAVEKYSELSKKDSLSPKWNIKIAEVYSVKNDLKNSLKYIDISKKYKSIDAQSYNSMVFTEFINGEKAAALKDGELALRKYPKDKNLIKTMFTVYMGNKKLEVANELMANYPVDIRSSYDIAEYSRMLMLVGKWEEGYTELKNAWELNKDEYKIYDVLAQAALYNKDSLLQNITALSKKHPNDLSYKMWLAKIYSLSIDTVDEANKLINELSNKNVGNMQIELIKANVCKNMNELEKSDKLIRNVISLHPDDYRAYHSAGWYYLYKKDYKKAKEYCNKSIQLNGEYPDNYGFLMPQILKEESTKLAAEPYFRTALTKEPYNYNIMLNLANYYWYKADNSGKALEYFNLASIIKPQDAEIKYNMALIKLADKKMDDAIKILKICSKLNELVPKYHRTLATIYMTQNKAVEAKVEIDSAYQGDEKDILTLNNTGCYYISFQQDLEKGFNNIKKAYEGLNDSYDDYTKKIIVENYDKVLKLKESYAKGKDNQELKIPEFTLFY